MGDSAPNSPADWLDQFRDVNGDLPKQQARSAVKLVIAHLHPGDVSASFMHSVQNTLLFDVGNHQRLMHGNRFGFIAAQSGAGRLERGRNDATRMFLDGHPDADMLLFIDSDMGFDPESVELLASVVESDPERFPVVGGLCFGVKPVARGDANAMRTHYFPTIYRWSTNVDEPGWDTAYDYPRDQLCEVGATGAAFVMLARSGLERMRERYGDHWWDPVTLARPDGDTTTFGEDLSFMMKARDAGLAIHCHTAAKTSHKKEVWVDEDFYDLQRRPSSDGVSVVIPVKDNLEMTKQLVASLVGEGGYDDLLIYDNGSGDETREWLTGSDQFDVFDASDATGISEMWNAGIAEAQSRHRGRADVILLNNDVAIGSQFCRRLIDGLHSDPQLAAVGGNYDGRPGSGVELVRGIAAGREDGTGGLPGFAMAIRADWLAEYRFPETLRWWYSDNDLCLSMDKAGAGYGIVIDAVCEHLDGGSQTDTPDGWDEIIAADRAEFLRLWPEVSLAPAAAGAVATAGAS